MPHQQVYKSSKLSKFMGRATVKIQIMPNSPEADLKAIEKKAEETIKSLYAEALIRIEEKPIAFGLNAIILTFTWNDDLSSDELENKLREIENISSSETLDLVS